MASNASRSSGVRSIMSAAMVDTIKVLPDSYKKPLGRLTVG
jgi:hypothetical protein